MHDLKKKKCTILINFNVLFKSCIIKSNYSLFV